MSDKIDVFAHALLPEFYDKMLKLDETIPDQYPFIQNPVLLDMAERHKHRLYGVKQVISYANINPEDYTNPKVAALLTRKANQELSRAVADHPDLFVGAAGMLALNNVDESVKILEDQIASDENFIGVQLFTRHMGLSLADESFRPIFAKAAELDLAILLHPVFDKRKPDNNIVFSWEYELTQAMLQLVEAGIFQEFPDLKIIVHHAGAMAPFFAGRIDHILPESQRQDFRKFYVDTAILGNPKALELAVDYFGVERVLFGTDAPFGSGIAGATEEIIEAIEGMSLSPADKEQIFYGNYERLFGRR